VNPSESQCGTFLDHCRCSGDTDIARTPAEMAARHRAAVARAQRSGWPNPATRSPRFPSRRGVAPALPPLTVSQRQAAFATVAGIITETSRGAA
jgi:hypothetical protein